MGTQHSSTGQILSQSLHLSSDGTRAREKAEEAGRVAYRRKYWQDYRKRVKRVFGTVTEDEYALIKARAEEAKRTPWQQLFAEARAYRNGEVLATHDIATHQHDLLIELRRIGNNINQLARLGHIQDRQKIGSDDRLGDEAHRQLERLERVVAKFDDGVTALIKPGA